MTPKIVIDKKKASAFLTRAGLELVTAQQAADELGISVDTVRNTINRDEPTAFSLPVDISMVRGRTTAAFTREKIAFLFGIQPKAERQEPSLPTHVAGARVESRESTIKPVLDEDGCFEMGQDGKPLDLNADEAFSHRESRRLFIGELDGPSPESARDMKGFFESRDNFFASKGIPDDPDDPIVQEDAQWREKLGLDDSWVLCGWDHVNQKPTYCRKDGSEEPVPSIPAYTQGDGSKHYGDWRIGDFIDTMVEEGRLTWGEGCSIKYLCRPPKAEAETIESIVARQQDQRKAISFIQHSIDKLEAKRATLLAAGSVQAGAQS